MAEKKFPACARGRGGGEGEIKTSLSPGKFNACISEHFFLWKWKLRRKYKRERITKNFL